MSVAAMALLVALVGCSSTTGQFIDLSVGHNHNCALREDGTAVCWGEGYFQGSSTTPQGKFISITSGADHACALRESGSVVCWLIRDEGQEDVVTAVSGDPARHHHNPHPPKGEVLPPEGHKFVAISAGFGHTCGLLEDGTPICWGSNNKGEASPPSDGKFAAIFAGFESSCGIDEDGTALCWGDVKRSLHTIDGHQFTQLSGGFTDICGLEKSGTVLCWDRYDRERYYPLPDDNLSNIGNHISYAYYQYRCGIRPDGTASCWYSPLGRAPFTLDKIPTDKQFIKVGTGLLHACGLLVDGSISCWGANDYGQGIPPPTLPTPTPVPTDSGICEKDETIYKGSACILTGSLHGDVYKFAVAANSQGILYDDTGRILASQYKIIDESYERIGHGVTYVVIRARANEDGSWEIGMVSQWE